MLNHSNLPESVRVTLHAGSNQGSVAMQLRKHRGTSSGRAQAQQVVPLVGGPTAVSRVEAELWREANAEGGGGGFLGTRVTTDDGEVVYADRMKLMAWCAPANTQAEPCTCSHGLRPPAALQRV